MSRPSVNYEIFPNDDLDLLNCLQRAVIQMRLGLPPYNEKYSLHSVADIVEISEGKVRIIELESLKILEKARK